MHTVFLLSENLHFMAEKHNRQVSKNILVGDKFYFKNKIKKQNKESQELEVEMRMLSEEWLVTLKCKSD